MSSTIYDIDFSAIDDKIREARKCASDFSEILQSTKKKDAETMELIENDRNHWIESYEEKAVMIEQLQRELSSTVEALQVERNHSKQLFSEETHHPIQTETKSFVRNTTATNQTPKAESIDYSNRDFSSKQLTRVNDDVVLLNQLLQEARMDGDTQREKLVESNLRQDELSYQMEAMRREMDRAKQAWREVDGKLQFRNSQVSEKRLTRKQF
jgi:hypothetical protein